MPRFAEVILPLPIRSNFHYRVAPEQADHIAPGQRVLVSFGRRKIYTGLVRHLSEEVPKAVQVDRLKFVEEILDEGPLLQESQMALFDWMAFYYFCTPGEVFKAALPTGLKPESALRVAMAEGLDWERVVTDDKEFMLLEALSIQAVLDFREVVDIWEINNPMPRLKAMEARGLIRLYHEVEETYKPKLKTYLRLSPQIEEEEALRAAFDSLSRAPSQENLLMYVVSAYYQGNTVPKTETLKHLGVTAQVAKTLVDKGYLVEEDVQIDRLALYGYAEKPQDLPYTPAQERALAEMREALAAQPRRPLLLHGITGSGKTLLYIAFIREALARGEQVLYLLPEITLTKQIIDRLKSAFGAQVGIYHSRFNDRERVEIWKKVHRREYQVVVGVRSALFLPFPQLGLIVVDESHDSSFKQHEPAPRYHARDAAIYYARQQDIPIILGSATPSFETFLNAHQGRYAYVALHERALKATLPQIEVVDMRIQRKKRLATGIFSNVLLDAIGQALARQEQVILFQNRRGYAPFLLCETCGEVPQCINCDISLTYHKERNHLRCHYCGHTDHNVTRCPSCGNLSLRQIGVGTEKIAEAVQEAFPTHTVERMDLDTTRSKTGYQHLINRFENRQIDILVGTQMVSKGLDFENVTLVGVIHADQLLNFPDFRAYEQAYQLLTQVAGRAGRRSKQGRVVIQTSSPDNPVLKVLQAPFDRFAWQELPGRQEIGYPPYTRLIRIEVRHPERSFIEQESLRLHNLLKPAFGAN
ncbi:MAG: primosomal protein N', partial [Bacteroidetes bacterium]